MAWTFSEDASESDIAMADPFQEPDCKQQHSREVKLGVQELWEDVQGIKKDGLPAIDGIKLHHNYRPHMDLDGHMSAQRTGVEIRGDNKRKTIIENA